MLRAAGSLLASALLASACFGQSSSTGSGQNTTSSILTNSPLENVRAGAVGERAPSNWVSQARERHSGLAAARREAQTKGESSSLQPDNSSGTSSTTSNSSSALSSLLGLLGSQGGGLSSLLSMASSLGLGDLSSLTSALGGSSSTTPTATNSSNTSSSSASLADLLALQQQMTGGTAKSINDAAVGGDTSSKPDTRSQTSDGTGSTTTEERKFWKRWVDSMLQTTFQGIVLGINTPTFIQVIKDGLRPIFGLPDPNATTNTNNNTGGGTGNTGGNGGSGGSGGGGSQI